MRPPVEPPPILRAARPDEAPALSAIAIDGDPNALPFYLKVGARQIGELRDSVDGQPRVRPLLRVEL